MGPTPEDKRDASRDTLTDTQSLWHISQRRVYVPGLDEYFSQLEDLSRRKQDNNNNMPHKPLRQLAAEKARGNKPANPSQLGDPIDLKAETSDEPDTSYPSDSESDSERRNSPGTELKIPRAALEGDPKARGEEKGVVVGLGDGAGPVGGVMKKGRASKL